MNGSTAQAVQIAPLGHDVGNPHIRVSIVCGDGQRRQGLNGLGVVFLKRTRLRPVQRNSLAFILVTDLPDTEIGMIQFGELLGRSHAHNRAPRMAHQEDFVVTEPRNQHLAQLSGVGDKLVQGHCFRRNIGREGFAGPALLPVNHYEMVFEVRIGLPDEGIFGAARAAMQE